MNVGDKVAWVGPWASSVNDNGNLIRECGVVTHTTWENGCYVVWQNGYEEPCRHANLRIVTTATEHTNQDYETS